MLKTFPVNLSLEEMDIISSLIKELCPIKRNSKTKGIFKSIENKMFWAKEKLNRKIKLDKLERKKDV